jgi:multisubunit Na+/H+ antiporter MnhB subunit
MYGPRSAVAINATLSLIVFVIAYRRNRRYFHRTVLGAIGVALAAGLFCPLGALIFYAISKPPRG